MEGGYKEREASSASPDSAIHFEDQKLEEAEEGRQDVQRQLKRESLDFASTETYIQSAQYLNESLALHGFPTPIRIEDPSSEDKALIVNCIYKLFVSQQSLYEKSGKDATAFSALKREYDLLQEK